MNSVILNNTGLLKGYQQVFGRMQTCYSQAMLQLTKAFGQTLILEGCVVDGGNIGDGTVVLAGEVLPFEGGLVKTGIAVVEVAVNEDYNLFGAKPFYVSRKAVPDDAGVPLSSFVRMSTVMNHLYDFNNPHQVDKVDVVLGNLPNAKSDSVALDSPDSLATSKAAWDLFNSFQPFAGSVSGSLYIGNLGVPEDNIYTVTHNLGHTNYKAILLVSTTEPDYPNGSDVQQSRHVLEKNANTLKVQLIEYVVVTSQQITLHWMVRPD